ncbi:hypothetical protein D3C81_1013530 [compost metagenome]
MPHGVRVLMHIGTGTQLVEGQVLVIGQPGEHFLGIGMFELQVELAAIAGGKNRRLATGRDPAEQLQRLDHFFGSEGHALADGHGGGLVVDAESNEGHAESLN